MIDTTGKYTAPATPPSNGVTVIATSVADNSKKGLAGVIIRSLQLNSAVPPSARAGSSGFLLTVNGWGFTPDSVVRWSGADRPTSFINGNTVTVTISDQDVATANVAELAVSSPGPGVGVSNPLLFAINPPGLRVLDRLNLASDGSVVPIPDAADGSGAAISGDGRVTAFVQKSQPYQILVRDTCAGADVSCQPSSHVASLGSDGAPVALHDVPSTPALSYTGRFVAFAPRGYYFSGHGFADLAVRDTCLDVASCVPSTVIAKADSLGHPWDTPINIFPSLGSDGRYVTLTNGIWCYECDDADPSFQFPYDSSLWLPQVFTWDTCVGAPAGCVPSQNQILDEDGNQLVWTYKLSANGRYVVFSGFTGRDSATWLGDTCAGVNGCTPSSRRILPVAARSASVSANGRFVAVPNALLDTCLDATVECTPSSVPYALNSAGQPFIGYSYPSAVSADGRWIAFSQRYRDFLVLGGDVQGDRATNDVKQVLMRDTCRGVPNCTPATLLLSQGSDGAPGDASSYAPAISADGRFVVFTSAATNLVVDGNQQPGVFRATTGAAASSAASAVGH
jgi:hypothetical protein